MVKALSTFFLIILLLFSFIAQSQVNTAPVNPPSGGFRIDGVLKANTSVGDWVDGTGSGGFVLTNAGVPLNATTTWLRKDAYNSNLDIKFTEGSKGNSNPITGWTWKKGAVQNKNDINNAMIHITTETLSGHTWVIGGGDRLDPSGSAYIDFEFLQNTLTRTGTTGNSGGFSSEGPDGGRTINDLLMTMEYRNGGGLGIPVFYRWALVAPGSYDYVSLTPDAGTAFAYTNDGTVDVPFEAFGGTTYAPKLFVEGAVDMTELISNISACLGLSIKTIMLKTKASPSPSAALMDLLEPLQVALNFGITVDATANPTTLDLAVSNTSQLQATASPAPNSLYSFSWVQVPASGGSLDYTNIENPVFTATEAGTYKFIVTATQIAAPNCSAKDSVIVTVGSSSAPCGVSGPSPVCPGSTNEYFYDPNKDGVRDSLPANFTSSWTLTNNTNGAQKNWAATTRVSVTAGATCNSTFRVVLTLTSTSGLVTSTCDSLVTVEDKTKPTISCPAGTTVQCIGNIPAEPANLAAFLSAGGSASDACDNSLDYAVSTGPLVGGACGGTMTRTFTVTDNCGNSNSCTQIFTVNDNTKPSISCPSGSSVQCLADVPAGPISLAAFIALGGSASDNCDQSLTYSFIDGPLVGGGCGGTVTRTHKVTDDCNNFQTCTQVFTVNDNIKPVITFCPADKYLNSCSASTAPSNTGTATASDNCSGTITPTKTDAPTIQNGCQSIIIRTWTATDACGNTATCTQRIIIIDRTAPVITCLATGNATITDDCGGTPYSFYTDNGNMRTWTAIDASGNTSTVSCPLPAGFTSQPNQVSETQVTASSQATAVKTPVTAIKQPIVENVNGIRMSAYPNPYMNEVNFSFISAKSGKALLEVFDLLGRRVGVVYHGDVYANTQKWVSYKIPVLKSIPMIYQLSIGNEKTRGKLMPLEK